MNHNDNIPIGRYIIHLIGHHMKHEQYSPRSQQNVMKNTTKRDNIANTVSKTLERRPSIKELQERNILEGWLYYAYNNDSLMIH